MVRAKSNLKHYYLLAEEKKVSLNFEIDYVNANLDIVNTHEIIQQIKKELKRLKNDETIAALKRKQEKSLKAFKKWKFVCLKKLKKADVPASIITAIEKCESKMAMEKIFDALPPILLFNLKLRKSEHGLNHLTLNSLYKPLYTGMTN